MVTATSHDKAYNILYIFKPIRKQHRKREASKSRKHAAISLPSGLYCSWKNSYTQQRNVGSLPFHICHKSMCVRGCP